MIYLYSFLFAGSVCLVAQIIYHYTSLTPGHITTFLVIIGCFLSIFGIYEKLNDIFGGGSKVLIMNFSYLLVEGGKLGVEKNGILGLFQYLLSKCSATLSFTIFISILCSFKRSKR